jgi:SNF2 family DNA or RNA helicase
MATLDNIDDNLVYYTERNEIFPKNDTLLHEMNGYKISSIIKNESLHTTFEHIDTTYSIGGVDFKSKIKDSFILSNNDAFKYLKKCNWGSIYEIIIRQTILPTDAIDYYLINYVNKTKVENIEIYYNHFIITIRINTNKEPDDFKKIYSEPEKFGLPKNNLQFIKLLKCMMKYDWEEMNNIKNKSDENMEVSTRISKCNNNYMSQKMIEQPIFLNYNMYYYQKADVNFMLYRERESDNKKFILDDKKIVNWGKKFQCVLGGENGNETCKFIPRRTIHNYEGELNGFYGGCLCNSPGLGKTLEILTLCCISPSLNLIIVPEHLYEHWIFEYNKHIKSGYMNLVLYTNDSINLNKYADKPTIVLITYQKLETCKKLLSINFTRLIIDEFHELFDNKDKTFPLVNDIKSQYRWAITGTPFVNSLMINNILNFIVKNKITNPSISKYKSYIDVFCEMFRKNTKESVENELALPKINENIYVLKLSEFEKTMYDSLATGIDNETLITRQMAFCINPNLYFQDASGTCEKFQSVNILEATIINMHQADYEKLFKKIMERKIEFMNLKKDNTMTNYDILVIYDNIVNKQTDYIKLKDILKRFYKDEIKFRGKFIKIDEVDNKIVGKIWEEYLKEKKVIQEILSVSNHHNIENITSIKRLDDELTNVRQKMIYFEQQMKLINNKTKKIKRKTDEDDDVEYVQIGDSKDSDEEITCSICLGEIDDDFTLVQCGHAYCTLCLKTILMQNPDQCPQCKFSLKNTILYTPRFNIVLNREMIEMIKKYGTKIAHLINICKKELSYGKTIIYCDSPSLIDNLVEFLNENEIATVTPSADKTISETINEFKTIKQVLVLSSEFNASGLNLQFATSIVILQPIRGEYARIRQTENQIIGRLHRIGQTKEINLVRLIIKDSIESDILRQNKIIDTEYTSTNKKTDYPMTLAKTKELDG